jgi:hypothetical protein
VAWAQSSKTYDAYSETAVSIARYLIANNRSAQSYYVVMGGYEANPIQYLAHNKVNYKLLDQKQLLDLPLDTKNSLVIIPISSDSEKDIQNLKAKFPNGRLSDVKSDFNGKILFNVFELSQ